MNSKIKWIVGVVIVVIIIILIARSKGTQNNQVLKIGAILPITGPVASSGEFSKNGVDMAVEDLAKEGTKIDIVYADYQYDSKLALSAYNKLRDVDRVNGLLTFGSPSAIPLSPLVNAAHIPLLSLVAGTDYSSPDDYTYRMMGSAKMDAQAAFDVLVNKFGKKKIAVIYLTNDYGVGALNELKRLVNSGASVVFEEGVPTTAADFRSQLAKAKLANPDALFLPMIYKAAGVLVKQAREMGINVPVLCGQPCENPDYVTAAGASAEGTFVMAPTSIDTSGFGARYLARFGKAPSYITLRSYDSVKIYAYIGAKCQTSNYSGECMKSELGKIHDFPGLSYPINFDKNGDIQDRYSVKIIKDGKFTPYNL